MHIKQWCEEKAEKKRQDEENEKNGCIGALIIATIILVTIALAVADMSGMLPRSW